MIKKMVMVFIIGLKVKNMMVNGRKENNMDKVHIILKMKLLKMGYGKKVKEYNGQMLDCFLLYVYGFQLYKNLEIFFFNLNK